MPDPENVGGETVETSESTPAETAQETGTTAETTSTVGAENSFFDPNLLPDDPEIQKAYKQMQGSYTRRMQTLSADQKKLEAYRQFEQNPVDTLKSVAQQYGYTLAGAQQNQQEFEPNDWNDVTKHITDSVLQKINPLISEVQSVKRTSIEAQLDASVPEWREYEDDMKQLMSKHPTLVDDPVTLARMAIPENVQQGKAMQAAMRKLEQKAKASTVTQGKGTVKAPDPSTPPKGATFQQIVDWAKHKLATEGPS